MERLQLSWLSDRCPIHTHAPLAGRVLEVQGVVDMLGGPRAAAGASIWVPRLGDVATRVRLPTACGRAGWVRWVSGGVAWAVGGG